MAQFYEASESICFQEESRESSWLEVWFSSKDSVLFEMTTDEQTISLRLNHESVLTLANRLVCWYDELRLE